MAWIRFAIAVYLATILQTALVPVVLPEALRPNVFVIVAVYYLLLWPMDQALIAALIIGTLADLTSISPLGSQIIAFGLMGGFAGLVRPVIFTDLPSAHAFVAFGGYIILTITYRIVTIFTSDAAGLPFGFFATGLQAFSTAIVAAAVCRLLVRQVKVPR